MCVRKKVWKNFQRFKKLGVKVDSNQLCKLPANRKAAIVKSAVQKTETTGSMNIKQQIKPK